MMCYFAKTLAITLLRWVKLDMSFYRKTHPPYVTITTSGPQWQVNEEISSGVTARGEIGVAGERRLFAEWKFYSSVSAP